MVKILVPAESIWDFYTQHQGIMEEEDSMYRIAENVDAGLRLYLSSDHGTPVFLVYERIDESSMDDFDEDGLYGFECIHEESPIIKGGASIRNKTIENMREVIEDWICPFDGDDDRDDKIIDREKELSNAISDFLDIALYKSDDESTVFEDEFLDDVLRLLHEKHGVNIYRPMYLEDDKGEFYEEYPYPHMLYR